MRPTTYNPAANPSARMQIRHLCLRLHGTAGLWWSAVSRCEWPDHPEQRAAIEVNLDGERGNARQERVFIGHDPKPEETRAMLDSRLLSDDEMTAGPELGINFDAPFPRWFAEDKEA